jgi:hypothetical protein
MNATNKPNAGNDDTRTVSEVAKEMQTHFSRTGAYRAADLRRVLGDPTQGIRGNVVDFFTPSSVKHGA